MTIQEKNTQALAAFTNKDHTYLHLTGKGADQHLVAKEIGWFGRIILWICVKFGCSSARFDKVTKYIVEQMNANKLALAQNTMEKLKKKITHYNERHSFALKTECESIAKAIAVNNLTKPAVTPAQTPQTSTVIKPSVAPKTPNKPVDAKPTNKPANATPATKPADKPKNPTPAKIVTPTQNDLNQILNHIGFDLGPNNFLIPKPQQPHANPTPNTKPLIDATLVDPNDELSQADLLAMFAKPKAATVSAKPTNKPAAPAHPSTQQLTANTTKTPAQPMTPQPATNTPNAPAQPMAPQLAAITTKAPAQPTQPPVTNAKVQEFIEARHDFASAKKVMIDFLKDYVADLKKVSSDDSLKSAVSQKEETFKDILKAMSEKEIETFAKAKSDPLFYADNFGNTFKGQDIRLGLIYEALEMGTDKFNAFIKAKIEDSINKPMLKRFIYFFGNMQDPNLRIAGFQSLLDILDKKMNAYLDALPGFISKSDCEDAQHPVNAFGVAYLKHISKDSAALELFKKKCPALFNKAVQGLD